MNIPCFVIVPNGKQFAYLRRFTFSGNDGATCPSNNNYGHDAMVQIEDMDVVLSEDGKHIRSVSARDFGRKDEYPAKCACGYEFKESDEWQVHTQQQYVREDKANDEKYSIRNPPAGALWRATWLEEVRNWCGEDGHVWCVMTPAGEWNMDSQASNCDKRDDKQHHCWCRHGVAPNFTVDKIGNTCGAGAGSILIKDYHGFLRNGELVDA